MWPELHCHRGPHQCPAAGDGHHCRPVGRPGREGAEVRPCPTGPPRRDHRADRRAAEPDRGAADRRPCRRPGPRLRSAVPVHRRHRGPAAPGPGVRRSSGRRTRCPPRARRRPCGVDPGSEPAGRDIPVGQPLARGRVHPRRPRPAHRAAPGPDRARAHRARARRGLLGRPARAVGVAHPRPAPGHRRHRLRVRRSATPRRAQPRHRQARHRVRSQHRPRPDPSGRRPRRHRIRRRGGRRPGRRGNRDPGRAGPGAPPRRRTGTGVLPGATTASRVVTGRSQSSPSTARRVGTVGAEPVSGS